MKYSIRFLYALFLKENYAIKTIKYHDNIYTLLLEKDVGGNQWEIILEPQVVDRIHNVMYVLPEYRGTANQFKIDSINLKSCSFTFK